MSACNNENLLSHKLNIIKLVAAFLLTFYVIAILSAWTTPVSCFEVSIYTKTPTIYWLSVILSMTTGIILICTYVFFNVRETLVKFIGILLLIFGSISLGVVQLIRGYFAINIDGDTGTHIGLINSVINSGTLPSTYSSYYPGLFSESAICHLLTSTNTITLTNYIPYIFIFIFILGSYLLAREVLPNSKMVNITLIVLLTLPFGSAPIVGLYPFYFAPGLCSTQLIPLLLYIILKMQKYPKKMMFIISILGIAMIFYHPLQTIELLCFFVVMLVIYGFVHRNEQLIRDNYYRALIAASIVIFILFFIWSWNFWGNMIVNMVNSLFTIENIDERGVEYFMNGLNEGNIYGYSLITYLKIGAIDIIIYSMIPLSILFAIKYISKLRLNKQLNLIALLIYVLLLIFLTCFMVISTNDIAPTRLLNVVHMCGIIFSGFVIYNTILLVSHIHHPKSAMIIRCSICAVLILIMMVSVFTLYLSPLTLHQTYQTTKTEYIGTQTLFPIINYEYSLTGIHYTRPERYIHAISGERGVVATNIYGPSLYLDPGYQDSVSKLPYNFNYNKYDTLSESYTNSTYIFIMQRDHEAFVEYFPSIENIRWSRMDFMHLDNDESVSEVYNNGGFNLYITLL